MAASSLRNSSIIKQDMADSHFEVDNNDQYLRKQAKIVAVLDAARVATTSLALLAGLTILGLAANALGVYNTTRLQDVSWLSLWPARFDLRPTVALVVGSAIVSLANIAALMCSKVPHIRTQTPLHTPSTFAAPLLGLAASLIAISFFYAVHASTTTDTVLSWTCRWQDVATTGDAAPRFGTLCRGSWAAVALAVALVPLEAVALCLAGAQMRAEGRVCRYVAAGVVGAGKGRASPVVV